MSLRRSPIPPYRSRAFMSSPSPKAAASVGGALPLSLSGSETDISTSNENLSNEEKYVIRHTERQEPQGEENLQSSSNRNSLRDSLPSNRSSLDASSSSYSTLIIHGVGEDAWTGRNSGPKEVESAPHAKEPACPTKEAAFERTAGVQLTEIPADYLSQSCVLKHLAKAVGEASQSDSGGGARQPPDYASSCTKLRHAGVMMRNRSIRSAPLSKSQPDLRKIDKAERPHRDHSVPRPKTNGRDKEHMWTLEFLIKENHELKTELEKCYMHVSKTQKLEEEVLQVHRSHEELVQTCDRRERLERAARARLQIDCRRLQEINRSLNEQLASDGMRREVNKRELLIAQLITQNKELQAAKERQEIELTAQRATLQEQRTHIDILEAALTNAQANVVRLEDEARKRQVYVERVVQLQRALSSLQLASDRREQSERQLRQQLELELERSRGGGGGGGGSAQQRRDDAEQLGPAPLESGELKRRLRDREEKIMRLEGECSKWEQRYLEESALRQAAIDSASIPKDAKIAALEKTSQETEKMIVEARAEKMRHMDEAHAAQKKLADVESRLKDLESRLAERDAMIRVLQKHAYDKDVAMLSRASPHPSIGSADLEHVLAAAVSREDLVSVGALTTSTSFGSANSYAGSDASSFMATCPFTYESKSFDSTKQTLDHQIKEIDSQLDSQLLSKRALCCFPGFANPVAAPRKGKIPKPLLASVASAKSGYDGTPQFMLAQGASRHEQRDILLLEKQGRASQLQRAPPPPVPSSPAASGGTPSRPPPSSLPRPPRPRGPGSLARRLGDYNRLGDGDAPPARRKTSDGGASLSSTASSRNPSPARSLIPSPRKLGEYGRLSESGASSVSLRKPAARAPGGGDCDSAGTFSDNSAGKVRFYSGAVARRSSSLARDSKSSTDSAISSKFRIQF